MTAKVENACATKRGESIYVNRTERACINCIWYERYFRPNHGNIRMWVGTSTGWCLKHDCERGALRQPCGDFEKKEDKP